MAINFPDPSASPWYNDPASGGNGVTYVYTTGGYWTAVQVTGSNAIDQTTGDARYVNVSGDSMTGGLNVAGNVGIGLTNPSAKLDVTGTGVVSQIKSTNNNYALAIAGNNCTYDVFLGSTNTNDFVIANENNNGTFAERLRIDSSGNVGIGTTSPDNTLHVHTGTAGTVTANSGADDLVVENSGDCGISLLTADNNTTALFFGCPTQTVGAAIRYNHNSSEMSLGPDHPGAHLRINSGDGAEAMRIDSSGNLGIGTAYPSAKLDVRGNIYTGDKILVNTSSPDAMVHIKGSSTHGSLVLEAGGTSGSMNQMYIQAHNNGGTPIGEVNFEETGTNAGAIVFQTNGGSLAERMRLTSSGNLGIGTSNPGDILHCEKSAGAIKVSSSSDSKYAALYAGDSSNDSAVLWQNGSLRFYNNTERMRIDSSGNVGIGNTAPGYKLSVLTTGTADRVLNLATTGGASANGDATNSIYFTGGTNTRWANAKYEAFNHLFHGNGYENMRLTSGGDLLINTNTNFGSSKLGVQFYGLTQNGIAVKSTYNGNGAYYFVVSNHAGTTIGGISASTTSTTYNTSSDYRLKENVVGINDGITRVKQLTPKRFNFIADSDTTVDGFFAHEVQTVVPEAITGTKDEVDADGNPVYQGIDQSKLVPLLTAALQEAIAKIETLEAKVAQLEGS